jgi:uncharacterized protein YgiM (DUF1202 family)
MRYAAIAVAAMAALAFGSEAAPTVVPTDGSAVTMIQLAQAGSTATVRVKSAILRAGPDTKSKKLASLRRGTKLQVTGTSGEWTKVKVGAQEGYVSTSLLNK